MGLGKVPEEAIGGRKQSYRVTMTTLRVAPTQTRLQVLGEKTGTMNRGVTVPDFPKENKHQPQTTRL